MDTLPRHAGQSVMTRLIDLIASRHKHQCDLCGVSIALWLMTLGLIGVLHMGPNP